MVPIKKSVPYNSVSPSTRSSWYSGYACLDIPFPPIKIEAGWAFARTPNPDKATFDKAMDAFTKVGISTEPFRRVPHSKDCIHLFEDTCLKREYPENKIEEALFFGRTQIENLVRKFLNVFGSQPPRRPVPVDEVNFFLNNTGGRG